MRSAALVLSALFLTAAVPAEDEQDRAPQAESRIAELEKENLVLKRKVAELRNLINKLYAERAGDARTARVTISFDGEPDPEHLRGIELPEKPSKYQVRVYVARILRAAVRHRGGYGASDPEVRLLRQVGPAHVDVLLEPLLYEDRPNGDMYVIEALKSLVREEHKELVLESLPIVRDLVQVVQARGWTKKAAPTLLKVLADRGSWTHPHPTLPTEWIEAVAELERPESYEHLKAFLYYGTNRYLTWKAMRGLPGIELKAEVERLWHWAKELDDNWVRVNLAAVAAHYGHLDALEALFEDPDSWPEWEVIESVTPYRGRRAQAEQAKKWFEVHHDRLVFDAAKGKYRLLRERKG